MALTKAARSKIFSFVQDAKRLLMKEVEEQLQQHYGIRPDGTVLMIEQLTTADSEIIYTARLLRQRLEYLKANLADENNKEVEAVIQLVREQAFTILNRFASLRMAEERGIIKETIRKEYNSDGFQVFDSITGQGQTASQYIRYKWYLYAIFDELSLDLPAMFDRYSPYALIFPSEQAMNSLLDIINNEEVTVHREDGMQPVELWKEDETIGWVYQYYNSKEEIKEMREASDLPRNSRELAVRNQFFTPRYVVQFLTDNSLGRIWYEMTQGNTVLKTLCPYLIKRPNEVFLKKGETKSEKADEEIQYVEYRPIKDPREILMLDPACGSMHFGLYAFDLMEHIYVEAWDNYLELMTDLRNSMTRQAYIQQIPEFIIRYNIHGVDIDPRALQIAGLSLWLRAQKSFEKQNLPASQRPQITKSNLVLAEPMPGSVETLSQLVQPLDAPMRKLVLGIWEQMKLAGELGLLLRIEEEIDKKIQEIAGELAEENIHTQLTLGGEDGELQAAEKAALYATKKYRDSFLDSAESQVLKTLKQLSETATNGDAYQKLLFADDTARGFAFIELCQKKYDVVVMNPPFGSSCINTEEYLDINYIVWSKNILAAFFERMLELLVVDGLVGAIFDRTVAIKSSYENFRIKCFCGHITTMADTGWNVLDANVETTTLVLNKQVCSYQGVFINLIDSDKKESLLSDSIRIYFQQGYVQNIYLRNSLDFLSLPNSIIGYNWEDYLIKLFKINPSLVKSKLQARDGHNLVSFDHFRNYWETVSNSFFEIMYNGGQYSMYYFPYRELTLYGKDGYKVRYHKSVNFRNLDYQKEIGVGYGKRGEIFDAHVLKNGMIFTKEGQAINKISKENAFLLLSFLNSILSQFNLSLFAGQHKASGYVNLLPIPNVESIDDKLFNSVVRILALKREWFSIDETCLEFHHFLSHFNSTLSLKTRIKEIQENIIRDKKEYLELITQMDLFWINKAGIPEDHINTFDSFKSKRPSENLISIDGITDETFEGNPIVVGEIISNLIGVAFGRWDILSIIRPELIPEFGDFFAPLPFMPVVSLETKPEGYPIDFPENGILVGDSKHPLSLTKAINKSIHAIWGSNADNIISELEEIGQFKSIEYFIENPNGFFDFHYKRYTKSRREAPIYWPLSTASGSYTIWVYYPRLNDQTLYRIVSDFIIPKKEEIAAEIKKLELNPSLDNSGKKQLLELQDLQHELQVMEKELIEVAALPFKPNHDDGVLITAAPLYKFFRHNKWRKATEDCWKALEKGEYDWAHLAYSIWPDRVTKKCKKDLSMAIAHGLEDICEVKPKEKKEKKVAKPKKNATQRKLIE